jgi:hypothetical protein
MPPETVTELTAEQVLVNVAPRDIDAKLAAAAEEVSFHQDILRVALNGPAGSTRLAKVPDYRKEVEVAEAAHAKLAKAVAEANAAAVAVDPSLTTGGSALTAIQKAVSVHGHAVTVRTESWAKGQAKSKVVNDAALKLIDDHIVELQAFRQSMVDEQTARQTAWTENQAKTVAVFKSVTDALQERLAAAQNKLPVTPMDTSVEDVEYHDDHYLTVLYSPSELPDHKDVIKKATVPTKAALSQMWGTVHAWPQHPGVQLTYTTLGASAGEGFVALKALLGEAVWTRLYGDRAKNIRASDVCPRSMQTPLLIALANASVILEQEGLETKVTEANTALTALGVTTSAKRRKVPQVVV